MSIYSVTIDGRAYELTLDRLLQQEFNLKVGDQTLRVRLPASNGSDWIIVNDRPYELHYDANQRWLQGKVDVHTVDVQDRDTSRTRPQSADGRVKAPIAGLIARIMVEPGQQVEIGQPILILEAMKMENEIRAPRSGQLISLLVQVGRVVKGRELLAEIV